ncbi:MAG: helix-turn-helix domain-containing protein [Jiangellaceae bacterium]
MIDGCHGGQPPALARLVAGAHTMVLHVPAGQAGSEHTHPEWTILLPPAGTIEWSTGRRPGRSESGVIFPPQLSYRAVSNAGHLTVFIDPWYQGLGRGRGSAVPLDAATVEHLADVWSAVCLTDPDESARETVTYLRQRALLPPAVAIDPRVAAALRALPATECVTHVAADVGLSPSRLRTLIHDLTGASPARLRLWRRLRTAMVGLADKPIALAAADAGFADQAHLTRTASRLIGQTPGDLVRMLQAPRTRRHRDDIPATAAVA